MGITNALAILCLKNIKRNLMLKSIRLENELTDMDERFHYQKTVVLNELNTANERIKMVSNVLETVITY